MGTFPASCRALSTTVCVTGARFDLRSATQSTQTCESTSGGATGEAGAAFLFWFLVLGSWLLVIG
jgi:hypothetical protein